jgi:hypothetical protein
VHGVVIVKFVFQVLAQLAEEARVDQGLGGCFDAQFALSESACLFVFVFQGCRAIVCRRATYLAAVEAHSHHAELAGLGEESLSNGRRLRHGGRECVAEEKKIERWGGR